MSDETRAVLQSALALPEEARGELIECLLQSMPPPGFVEMNEAEFHAELQRRAAEARDGTDPGIPWSELKATLLSDIDAHAPR